MVRAVPSTSGGTRGHLPPRSAVARAVGEGPRGRSTGGEGLPRKPGTPRGGGSRPRTPGVLAEVVLSLQHAPPGQPGAGRLAAGAQTAAHQPVLIGRRPDRGARSGSERPATVRRGTHGGPREWPALVDRGVRGDRPRRSASQRTPGHRGARVRPSSARRGTGPG